MTASLFSYALDCGRSASLATATVSLGRRIGLPATVGSAPVSVWNSAIRCNEKPNILWSSLPRTSDGRAASGKRSVNVRSDVLTRATAAGTWNGQHAGLTGLRCPCGMTVGQDCNPLGRQFRAMGKGRGCDMQPKLAFAGPGSAGSNTRLSGRIAPNESARSGGAQPSPGKHAHR